MQAVLAMLALVVLGLAGCARKPAAGTVTKTAGASPSESSRCRTCHPAFYKKWATSHHGKAMQPYTGEFAKTALTPQAGPLRIMNAEYRAVVDEGAGYVEERAPGGVRKLPITQVMGGKNTYYFLTPMERGRLQVLPVAYDVQKREWYDMAASGVRMHGEGAQNQPLPWTDSAFTYNTSCYSCHVSQSKPNYHLASDSYDTTWREPGINCETCHGEGDAHVALYTKDLNAKHKDIRIIRTTRMTVQQRNEMCAPCHAKMSPVSPGYQVTQRFFDHYDLVTLEDQDYYPDGRDLGENYTYTSWLMSPCIRNGKFDCIHCHTSSGRYKFAVENPNGACSTCHEEIARNVQAHSHHKPGMPGSKCIDCHMPKTRFANMNRSDHSMLPPTPALTVKYRSPNACNLCHKERSAAWADAQVRKWHKKDYQKPVLERAALVDAARRRDWTKLPAMLAYVDGAGGDDVVKASLIRLLVPCEDKSKWPVLIRALGSANPLVRAAAAGSFAGYATPETREALARAAGDEYRLVRIRAAASLAGVPVEALPPAQVEAVRKATGEMISAYQARPDDFANHTNLGNYYMERGELDKSIASFETALRLRPDSVGTLVNASIAYGRAGRTAEAVAVLDRALKESPDNAPANFNKGLLLAEAGRKTEAEAALKRAVKSDATLAPAAYNLGVLLLQEKRPEGMEYLRQAVKSAPLNEKYVFSLAFYLDQARQPGEALRALEGFAKQHGGGFDTRMLLAELQLKNGKIREAEAVYREALQDGRLDVNQRRFAQEKMRALGRGGV